MSVQATSWVWAHSDAKGNDLLVLLAVADAANKQGQRSCQAVRTVAEMARVSVRTAHRSLRKLEETGQIIRRGNDPRYAGAVIYDLPGVETGGPVKRGGDNLTPPSETGRGGDKSGTQGVSNRVEGGDTVGIQPQYPTGTPQKDNPTGSAEADADVVDAELVEVEPVTEDPWTIVATKAYDSTDGALNYLGMRAIAKWAIEHKRVEPFQVEWAMAELWRSGRAVTKQTVGQFLDGYLNAYRGHQTTLERRREQNQQAADQWLQRHDAPRPGSFLEIGAGDE